MKKVFVSFPMSGKTSQDIKEEARMLASKAIRQLDDDQILLLPSVFEPEESTPPIVYLARSIEKMAYADVVFFALGWEKARGCTVEHLVATLYNKEIVYENE